MREALTLIGILIATAIVLFSVFLIYNTPKNSNNGNSTIPYTDKYIDLHLHLDGAITMNIAKQLAVLQNITLPTTLEVVVYLFIFSSEMELLSFLK